MNTNLYSFATKKDKEDAIIAGLVVLFFCILGFYLVDSAVFSSEEAIALKSGSLPAVNTRNSVAIDFAKDSVKTYTSIDEWVAIEGEPIAEEYAYLPFKDRVRHVMVAAKTSIQPSISTEKTNQIVNDTAVKNETVSKALKKADNLVIEPASTVAAVVAPKKEEVNTTAEKLKPTEMSFPTQKKAIETAPKNTETKVAAQNAMASPIKKEVVKPVETKQKIEATAKKEIPATDDYCVAIIGSFKSEENIEKLTKKFIQQGYKVYKTNRNTLTAIGVYVDCNNPKPIFNKMRSEFGAGVWLLKSKN